MKKTTPSKNKPEDSSWDEVMNGLSISEQSTSVFVTGSIPCIVTTFLDKYKNPVVAIDMHCFSGVREDSYEFSVSDCRSVVTIEMKTHPTFLDSSWLEQLDEKNDVISARQQTFARVVEAFKKQMKTKEVVSKVQVKVPFKIEKNAKYAEVSLIDDIYIFTLMFSAIEKRVSSGKVKVNTPVRKSKSVKLPDYVPSSTDNMSMDDDVTV